jgi:hypothetical protein
MSVSQVKGLANIARLLAGQEGKIGAKPAA